MIFILLLLVANSICCRVYADGQSDLIQADREALSQAESSGDSTKIIEAKEVLSDDLSHQQEQQRIDAEGITIPLTPDGQGHLLADVLLNNGIHASLIVDTGSPVVMLTSSFVNKLGVDLSQSTTGYVEVLNGKYKAAAFSLNSIKVGQIQTQDVSAIVLLDSSKGMSDGLLGLSFLSKFHFTLDQAGQKLILRKIE